MENTDRFDLMIQALAEVAEEERVRSPRSTPLSGSPILATVIANASPIPEEALFIGKAEDDLPVLLNLYDPIPGPLLVTGDSSSGKTALLKMIARGVEIMHSPTSVEYCVITNHPNEWTDLQNSKSSAGIHSSSEKSSQELLQSLTEWAHNNKGDRQSILLLIDDLEPLINADQLTEQNLRWLLLRGPSRRVWPIVTLNSSRAQSLSTWLEFFRTRLFGNTQDAVNAQFITGLSEPSLNKLVTGSQFAMREGNHWLRFWLPNIE